MSNKTKSTVFTGLAAALICVIAVWQIPLPAGVPLTFQVFAVAFAGYTLGCFRGTLAALVDIAVGALGLPVFSGFMGGVSVLAGPSGGFVFGFLPLCILCGLGSGKKTLPALASGIAGLAICHFFGVLRYSFVMNCGIVTAFLSVSLWYLLKDMALVAAAYFISHSVKKRVHRLL